jgi:hypothetical protein
VPQIWMTYEELASMLDCSAEEARALAHLERLDRKISRDGQKRAKLNAVLSTIFIQRLRGIATPVDDAIDELWQVHRRLQQADRPQALSSGLHRRGVG